MELTGHGLTLWFGTPDTPCPGADFAGGPAVINVGVAPAAPANRVQLRYRVDDSFPRYVHGTLVKTDARNTRQYFRAQLPWLPPGAGVKYAPIFTNSRHTLTTPDYPGAFSVPARRPSGVTSGEPRAAPPTNAPAISAGRFPFQLEFLFGITCQMRREVIGATPDGLRFDFLIEHGVIKGPRLNGRFRAEGGDWMRIRPDGIGIPDIRVTFELDDRTLILMESAGTFDLGPDGYTRALAGQFPPFGNFMSTPRFHTSNPNYAWLARASTFGVGLVDMKTLVVRDDVFQIVRAGGQ